MRLRAPAWLTRFAVNGLAALALAGCGGPQVMRITGPAQGASYSVKIVAPPEGLDRAALRAAMREELDAVDSVLSTWRDDSDITRFNAAPAGEWIGVAPALAALARRALAFGRDTDGAFEITLAPVLRLWGFGPGAGEPRVPGDQAISAALRTVGAEHVRARPDPSALRKARDGVRIELSGLAQGYTVDRMAARLDALGAERYLVGLGGELFGRGENPRGEPWRIGIERPEPGVRVVHGMIALDGVGISTSGDYRDYFEADGRRYSHTIDPRSGRPVAHDLRSVTVVDASTERADALATALLVMGPEQGPAFARDRGIAAMFIRGEPGAYTDTATTQFEQLVRPQ